MTGVLAILLVGTIYSRAAVAAPAVRLTDVTASGNSITSFQLQGGHAAVLTSPGQGKPNQLLGVGFDGATAPIVLNDPSVPGASPLYIDTYKFKPHEPGVVLFRGSDPAIAPGVAKYFQASFVAPAMTRELTDVERRIYFNATVLESDYSHEYVVRQDGSGIQQIYRVPLLGDGPEIQLTAHTFSGTGVDVSGLVPGEQSLLYRADAVTDGAFDVYTVPTDGSTPAVRLNPLLANSADVTFLQVTSDGLQTTFRVDGQVTATRTLYTAPTNGSGPAKRLSLAPNAEGVGSWQFTPDEQRVLYMTSSPSTSFAGGLYSVSATNPTGDHFRISSDAANRFTAIYDARLNSSGDRVIYDGFLNTSTSVDLLSASTTQPGTQIQLNTRSVENGDVRSVTLIEGGDRVVYRGDMDTRSFDELYAADTDQAGTQMRISGPVASDVGSISAYQLSPDEAHAVYTKVSPGRSARDLFSASTSVAESEVVLLLSDSFTSIERSSTDANSDWVVAHVETTSPADVTRDWLFAIPIDGGVPVRLSNRLPEHGEIRKWEFAPNGLNVVYAADLVVRAEEVPYCPGGGRGGCNPPGTRTVFVGSPELYATQLPIFSGQVGDMDGNGIVDGADLQPFALGVVNPRNFAFQFGLTPVNFGDLNEDGEFNELDAPLFAAEAGVNLEAVLNSIARAGDYNDDGVVDAADYSVWRNAKGSSAGALPNDVDGGVIGDAQFFTWKANFGSQAGDGPGLGIAAPEPGAMMMLACALAFFGPIRRR